MNDALFFESCFQIQSVDIELNNFVCHVKNECPANCVRFITPYNSTLHVHCAGMGLKEVPLNMPDAHSPYVEIVPNEEYNFDALWKYDLDISGNGLGLLDARLYFENTVSLNAANSSIENISVEALIALQQAEKIYLHDNLLTTLPPAVTSMNFSFSSLSLHGNPLDCSCEQV